LVSVLIHLVGIPVTNTSVNPARSIGPAVFVAGRALSQLWLSVVAPLIGAVLAAAVYRGITLPTPEIPARLAEQALPSEQVERKQEAPTKDVRTRAAPLRRGGWCGWRRGGSALFSHSFKFLFRLPVLRLVGAGGSCSDWRSGS
jgi:hypothetical protein